MKSLIIGVIVIVILMSLGLIGFLPGILAGPPEGAGAPANIVSPLDENGNVKVSQQGPVAVTPTGPISVTAPVPLEVTLPPSPNYKLEKLFDGITLAPGFTPGIFQDVKGYSKFKLYVKLTPGPIPPPPPPPAPWPNYTPPQVSFIVWDSPEESELGLSSFIATSWNPFPFGTNPFWGSVYEFDHVYSAIAVSISNQDAISYNVDCWLLMGN